MIVSIFTRRKPVKNIMRYSDHIVISLTSDCNEASIIYLLRPSDPYSFYHSCFNKTNNNSLAFFGNFFI